MGNRLYVGNLSFDSTEESVRGVFEEIGEVTDVRVMRDRDTGRHRGFGFVTMGNDSLAQDAISKLNGAVVDGRPIRVNEAEDRRPRDGGGGGGGFGGGGGGGGRRDGGGGRGPGGGGRGGRDSRRGGGGGGW